MGIHDGHRQRLRERFQKDGLDNFDEINVLEILLFYIIPRQDTNEVAHRLLDRFGSLENVLDAKLEDLVTVKGISDNAATYLTLIREVSRYYQVRKADLGEPLNTVEAYCNVLVPQFLGRRNEMVYMLCLDAKSKMISCNLVGEGSINSANVPVRKIIETALAANATMVVLAHNHPGGVAIPSAEDIYSTKHLAQVLDALDILLLDHVVVADNQAVSMVSSGQYKPEI
ncbi:MAG: DNA repair protein RadC [Oscillospiraceae bacterium]|nr:DNA repair protein RadC [Oscillospiraceae bacterium]